MDYTEKWASEISLIKKIIQKAGLEVAIKWGAEVYSYQGKNLISYAAFKNYVALWFYNGVYMEDKYKVLLNAQEGKTKALRQWRFENQEQIDETKILEYIAEAKQNIAEGKVWKAEKTAMPQIPDMLISAFENNTELNSAFGRLTPYKQKEYIEYIETAKREETRKQRLLKITPMILKGIGLNDKYKSCC